MSTGLPCGVAGTLSNSGLVESHDLAIDAVRESQGLTEMNPSTPVTSEDVARHANVSQSAVSRAFTPGASVSLKMREKILKSAAELGYRPNALARAMISGKSGLIAMLVAYLDNQFYPVMLEQLSRRLQASGYQVLLFMTEPGDQDEVVGRILQYQVEGIVMASATLSSDLARECARTGIPVVLFNRYVATSPASCVTSDNIEGGRLIADYLVRGGHERIGFIAGAEDSSTNRDREAGFYNGLAEHGLAVFERVVGGYSFEGAAAAARVLFDRPDRPDAVFVANDHMAFSVMDVLRDELGLRIPEDVSVIGYDDVPQAAWKGYDLTTVSQAGAQMVEATAEILVEQIEQAAVRKRAAVLPAELIVRSSARIPQG
ncbi:LacI family DNA-binding transcriptional regulator [Hoeflea phototrophica]|nr:LacI family DNA-binding transcriptional regulator [Hoeflea phototrophica]